MRRRQPRDPERVVTRLRAALDRHADDFSTTPAFAERVRRLRDRRRRVQRTTAALSVTAAVALAGFVAMESLRPAERLNFAAPPQPSPSATVPAVTEPPSARPSPSPTASERPEPTPPAVLQAPASEVPSDDTPPASEEPSTPATEPEPGPDLPPPTLVVLDGDPRSGFACLQADGTVLATLDHPESETAYVIDRSEPPTMTIYSEGVSDVSDSVSIAAGDVQTVYTATFGSDNDDFLLSEVRVEAPTDLPSCG